MTIHVGILGGGNISETHASAVSETDGARVVAVCGENGDRVARLAERYDAAIYTDTATFLDHRPMEVVLIGSPSGRHAEQGVAAARRKLHVLVEKPIDISTAQADSLILECENAGVQLGVFFQDRVAPDIVALKKMVETNALGRLLLASARVKWYRPTEYYKASRWRGTWALDGGGALINQGIHTVDLLLWLMGDVARVYAKAITALHPVEVEDTVVATLEFTSGAVATLEATTIAYPGYPRQLEITGSEGTVRLEHDRIIAADLRTPSDGLAGPIGDTNRNMSASSPVVSDVRGHQKIFADFLQAIATRGVSPPTCSGREARRSVALIEAIYESSRRQKPIALQAADPDKVSRGVIGG